MSQTAIGVVGQDGYTPIYQPDGRWALWSIHEIYLGAEGLNRYVPKVGDWVVEPESGDMYKVATLSEVTFIPELVPVEVKKQVTVEEITSESASTFRIYFDKSVLPYTLSVDGFLRVNGMSCSFARIYRGYLIDPTKIISRRYNNSGVFVGHDIPLELVKFQSADNYAVKSIPTCNTDQDLPTGEVCTVVVYDSNGKFKAKTTCIVEETTFVAQAYAEQRYITEIFIKSAFISDTTSNTIQYPVNLPVQSFNPIGVVQYNDGSQVEYPVDGTKFSLYGMEQFVSTIIGHRVPLVLKYRMDSTEAGLASVTMEGHDIVRPYSLMVSSSNTSYNAKLYVYPVWVDSANGYRLSAYLTNLDRNICLDVTNHIALSGNSPSFNPTAYGITQRLIFSIDLANVSGVFNHFLHVQTVDIVLRAPANDSAVANIWEVACQVPSPGAYYGTNLRATIDPPTRKKLSIHNNLASVNDFITKVYNPTNALFNPETETGSLTPTHLRVGHLAEEITIPITDYANAIQFTNEISYFQNVTVTFLRQTTTGFLQLSVAALTVR